MKNFKQFNKLTGIILLVICIVIFSFIIRSKVKHDLSINSQTRLLVIAPHCDDEVLSSAGLISQVLEKKGKVLIILLTNGDGFFLAAKSLTLTTPRPADYLRLGIIRQQETLEGLALSGITEKDVHFLSYPDAGLNFLWMKNWIKTNPYGNGHTKVSSSPYSKSFRPNVLYTGENLFHDLKQIFENFHPTIIIYPHPEDQHLDHRAAYGFVKTALANTNSNQPVELNYLIHYEDWPLPVGKNLYTTLDSPETLKNTHTKWLSFPVSFKIRQCKLQMVQKHKTQMEFLGPFLLSFVKQNELFAKINEISVNKKSKKTIYLLNGNNLKSIKKIQTLNTGDNISLDLKLNHKMFPNTTYGLDFTLIYTDREIERILFQVKNGEKQIKELTSNHLKDVILKSTDESITCIFPRAKNPTLQALLISGYVQKGNKFIEETGFCFTKVS